MYQATIKPWRCVLNYHAACLLEIERGNLKWGDNFQLQGLQNTTLYAGQSLGNSNSSRNNGGGVEMIQAQEILHRKIVVVAGNVFGFVETIKRGVAPSRVIITDS